MSDMELYQEDLRRAWIQNKMAWDHWCMILALVGFVGHVALAACGTVAFWYMNLWALLLFLGAGACSLAVFDRNAAHLMDVLTKNAQSSVVLMVLDAARTLFLIAAVLVTVLMVMLPTS
jgi:hypothetical protein